jgi:alpha-L-rhamnosidase
MSSNLTIQSFTCEYAVNPIGVDNEAPRFGWKLVPLTRGAKQSAYCVRVYDESGKTYWYTGKTESVSAVSARYAGEMLSSATRYICDLTVWNEQGEISKASASFETALFHESDWKAKWIRGGNLLRKEFSAGKKIASARAYICGLGYYELYLNGEKVGDHVLDPVCTDYDQTARYVTYDIEPYLRAGKNAIGVMLGNGRYCPYESTISKNWHPLKKYGETPVLIYQQEIRYTDGTAETVVSDLSWKTSQSPITFDDIYDGERYDARLEQPGWNQPGFDERNWNPAIAVTETMGRLVSQSTVPPIRVVKARAAMSMTNPAPGVYLYDFGQNFSGWARLRIKAFPGAVIRLHFAELKDEKTDMLCANTNRNAEVLDVYTCKSSDWEEWQPRFTYHGFRYAELSGDVGTPSIDTVEGRVVHTDVPRVGSFFCGNELINKIHSNYIWTQLSNLHGVPTDCCQRDERMGWVGDAQLSAEAAVHNFDMAAFYEKFEDDIRGSQLENGSVAGVSPPYWSCYPADPTYATACVEFPRLLSLYYDDQKVVEDNLEAMMKWVDYLGTQEDEEGIVSFGLFGDWCPPMHANPVETPFEITSTWYYCFDALIVSTLASRIGRMDVAKKYGDTAARVADAFNKRFLKGDRYSASRFSDAELAEKIKSWLNVLPPEQRPAIMKRYATLYSSSSQTANLLPLYLDIVPDENVREVVGTLIQDINFTRASHINTGVVGLKFIFDVLMKYGNGELCYELLNQTSFPSFGYQILKEGATTLWERWEFLSNDKCFNSHSHPFAGSVDVFFYKYLAGLRIEAPGFSKITIRPEPLGDLPYASASIDTPRGVLACGWRKYGETLQMDVTIPCSAETTVYIPKNGHENVRVRDGETVVYESGKENSALADAADMDGYIRFTAEAGRYAFTVERLNNGTSKA